MKLIAKIKKFFINHRKKDKDYKTEDTNYGYIEECEFCSYIRCNSNFSNNNSSILLYIVIDMDFVDMIKDMEIAIKTLSSLGFVLISKDTDNSKKLYLISGSQKQYDLLEDLFLENHTLAYNKTIKMIITQYHTYIDIYIANGDVKYQVCDSSKSEFVIQEVSHIDDDIITYIEDEDWAKLLHIYIADYGLMSIYEFIHDFRDGKGLFSLDDISNNISDKLNKFVELMPRYLVLPSGKNIFDINFYSNQSTHLYDDIDEIVE